MLTKTKLAAVLSGFALLAGGCTTWAPIEGKPMTRWASKVNPAKPFPDYPRPQLVRDNWKNLNGLWEYAITPIGASEPTEWEGEILVPYAIESALSGVGKRVGIDEALWYRTTFKAPKGEGRLLLNFDAVDWDATVFVNGKKVGQHKGCFDPFSFDVTDALTEGGEQELVVYVTDPTDAGPQPRGKQIENPNGIWYTPVTGIWQSVWMERAPQTRVERISSVSDVDAGEIDVTVHATGNAQVQLRVSAEGKVVAQANGRANAPITVDLGEGHTWSPDDPFLYDLEISLGTGAQKDEVESYLALREVGIGKDERGINRLLLNGKPIFHYGPLDQGWWPDGLLTPPTEEAMWFDLKETKRLGFNMTRKHTKTEPSRWYYMCDKLGLMVWQDMPTGFVERDRPTVNVGTKEEIFERELRELIKDFGFFPCIVEWVVFNEGWGQHDTPRYVKLTEELDDSRIISNASGWTDRGVGDLIDAHIYPGPGMPDIEDTRAAVLGEFGGLGLPVSGHTWQEEKNWGYRSYENEEALTDAYIDMLEQLRWLIDRGLAAAVYTQLTDVEVEVNGLYTYDREVLKMDPALIVPPTMELYKPASESRDLVPTSQDTKQDWKYTLTAPESGWTKPGYNDSAWKSGKGGFGTRGTPNTSVGTVWNTDQIWIRRTFNLSEKPDGRIGLMVHHDEDAEIYINGVLAAELSGWTSSYQIVTPSAEAVKALKKGTNTIAVRCKQTDGGQYIDVGLVEADAE